MCARAVCACACATARPGSTPTSNTHTHATRPQVLWAVVVGAVSTHGKNAQQIIGSLGKQLRAYRSVFSEFAGTARLEGALINDVQVRRDACACA